MTHRLPRRAEESRPTHGNVRRSELWHRHLLFYNPVYKEPCHNFTFSYARFESNKNGFVLYFVIGYSPEPLVKEVVSVGKIIFVDHATANLQEIAHSVLEDEELYGFIDGDLGTPSDVLPDFVFPQRAYEAIVKFSIVI